MRDRGLHRPQRSFASFLLAAVLAASLLPSIGQQPGATADSGVSATMPEQARARLHQLEDALKKAQADGDRRQEAAALIAIAETYLVTGDSKTSMDDLERALPIVRDLNLKQGEAMVLMDMGTASRETSNEQQALTYANQALAIFQALGNRTGEAQTLNNRAIVYYDLGDNEKALADYQEALKGFEDLNNAVNAGIALNNIGRLYHDMGQMNKALDSLNRALPLLEQTNAIRVEGRAEKNLGNVYREMGNAAKAMEAYGKALEIMNSLGDRSGQAMTYDDRGTLHARRHQQSAALDDYKRALAVALGAAEPLQAALVYSDLMHLEQEGQPTLAIYYGKQSINLLQQVRGNIHAMDRDLQKSFLTSKADYYHDLAELMIGQGRLPEAQQVLDLLKQQEYSDYVRGETADPLSPLSLSPAEQKAEEDYQQSTSQLMATQQRWSELKAIAARTPEQDAELKKLTDAIAASNQGLDDYFERLYKLFDSNDANDRLAAVKGNTAALDEVIGELPNTVALYTAVTKNRYSVIVISGAGHQAGRKYDITAKDLNEKIAAFQHALRSPASDPKPLAQELYKILIGPVQADLNQAKAKTLVWSLDGALRYVPIAALYDGKHYLVERYNVVAFTPASIPYLESEPNLGNLSAVAMGISRKYQEGLNPLPSVASELSYVVKDPSAQGATGVLPGTILLDGKFTEKAMEDQLATRHSVVHIASHFVLQPGDASQSYLLLSGKESEGAGYHLTVADFRNNPNIRLRATDLLTLSACETGVSTVGGNGREVDGLATTAQLKGAKAVLSTLWPVNDASTGALMADFYKRWSDGAGKVAKVEALRQAQLDLLLGKTKPASAAPARGLAAEDGAPVNTVANYAHPYYWAPFVLTGNWR